MEETLRTSEFDSPIGPLRIVSSEKGLVYVVLPHANGRGFEGWRKVHANGARVIAHNTSGNSSASTAGNARDANGAGREKHREAHAEMVEQLQQFLDGERREFTLDLDLRATPFQRAVYKVVAGIGYGETLSYSDVAEAIGNPKAVRAVGAANGANPIPLVIPCHRVIARGGALQGYAGGLDMKARLLAMESAFPPSSERQARLF